MEDQLSKQPDTQKNKLNTLFYLTVLLPTFLAVIYFGYFASDVYLSESRFIVRSSEGKQTSALGMVLNGVGISRTQDDVFAVQSFILSRDAARILDRELDIRKLFSTNTIDIFSRFPGLYLDRSFENFVFRYYPKHVDVQIDINSPIITLTTRAFSARDAHAINLKLIEQAENLVNTLNQRSREDMIKFTSSEIKGFEKKAKNAGKELARFRNQKGVIDPERQSVIPLQQIAKLEDELVATKTQILQIEKVARNNPRLPILYSQQKMIESEIKSLSKLVAGGGEGSLAGKAAEYQRLVLEKELADKMLAEATSRGELARQDAIRQHLYIERVAEPSLPDSPMEPYRIRNILATFLLGMIVWGVLSLMLASVKEHMD